MSHSCAEGIPGCFRHVPSPDFGYGPVLGDIHVSDIVPSGAAYILSRTPHKCGDECWKQVGEIGGRPASLHFCVDVFRVPAVVMDSRLASVVSLAPLPPS